jgi:hypothetical protein
MLVAGVLSNAERSLDLGSHVIQSNTQRNDASAKAHHCQVPIAAAMSLMITYISTYMTLYILIFKR